MLVWWMMSACVSLFTESHFPAVALLIFGTLCVVAILLLVAILQQEKYVLSVPPLFKNKNPQ